MHTAVGSQVACAAPIVGEGAGLLTLFKKGSGAELISWQVVMWLGGEGS